MVSRRALIAGVGGLAGGYLTFAPSSPVDVEVNESKIPFNASELAAGDNPPNSDEVTVSNMAQSVHKHTNSARITEGESGLDWSGRIAEVAQSFAERMASEEFYSHDGPNGSTPEERMSSAGLNCYSGENIDKTYWKTETQPAYDGDQTTYLDTADKLGKSVVGEWMHSEGHRKNLLRSDHAAEGVGVAVNSKNSVYVVQDFCDENPG